MAEQSGHEQDPRGAAEDLSEREEQRVPRTDLSQSQDRERHRGVHVGAGSLAPSRVDQRNRGESHSNPAGDVAPCGAANRPMNGRVRSSEQRGDDACRNHERSQGPSLDQVLGPVLAQRGFESGGHELTAAQPPVSKPGYSVIPPSTNRLMPCTYSARPEPAQPAPAPIPRRPRY